MPVGAACLRLLDFRMVEDDDLTPHLTCVSSAKKMGGMPGTPIIGIRPREYASSAGDRRIRRTAHMLPVSVK